MNLYISLVCAALTFAVGWLVNGWRLGAELESLKTRHANAIIEAQMQANIKTEERIAEAGRIAYEANIEKNKAIADARSANTVADQLRERIRTINRSGCPATLYGSKTAGTARDLYTDVFSRIDEVAGELAEYADRSRIAGTACEKQYNSLK